MIKAVDENFLWVIVNFGDRPVHSISIYCPPKDNLKAEKVIHLLRWITTRNRLFVRDHMRVPAGKMKIVLDLKDNVNQPENKVNQRMVAKDKFQFDVAM